jgi:hypothetical protein
MTRQVACWFSRSPSGGVVMAEAERLCPRRGIEWSEPAYDDQARGRQQTVPPVGQC